MYRSERFEVRGVVWEAEDGLVVGFRLYEYGKEVMDLAASYTGKVRLELDGQECAKKEACQQQCTAER